MQDIANEFGVTHAALYYHFQNKQDILAQINVREMTTLLADARGIAEKDSDVVEKLLALIENHMSYVANNPAVAATLFEHDLEMPQDDFEEISQLRRQYTRILTKLYQEGRKQGRLPDIDATIAVSLLLGACNWIYRWFHPTGRLSSDELVHQGMVLLRAMLTPPSD